MSESTRNSPVYAPNGIVVSGSGFSSQAGIDVLANGGTAADAAVASLVVTLSKPRNERESALCALVARQPYTHVAKLVAECFDGERVMETCHALLQRLGSRSWYDLIRMYGDESAWPHDKPAPGAGRQSTSVHSGLTPSIEEVGGPSSAAQLPWSTCDYCTEAGVTIWSASPVLSRDCLRGIASSARESPSCGTVHNPSAVATEREANDHARIVAIDHRGLLVMLYWATTVDIAVEGLVIAAMKHQGSFVALTWAGQGRLGITQVLRSRVRDRVPLQAAIEAPRLGATADGNLVIEDGAHVDQGFTTTETPSRFSAVRRWSSLLGAVDGIEIDRANGMLVGASDPRGHGQAAGY